VLSARLPGAGRALRAWGALAVASLAGAGCTSIETSGPGDAAGLDAPIATSAGEYTLAPSNSGLAVDIPIRFHNVTGRTLSIVNCRGGLAPVLERRVGGGWEPFWHGVQLQCLSPPIVIPAGEWIDRTVQVWGALPQSNMAPQFASGDVAGTYRIVLHSVVFDYDSGRPGFGTPVPLEQRISNTFELRR
jgi:hypothetical protein